MPKIKSRKIFSTKTSAQPEVVEPPPGPKPYVIDPSPVRISTISSLVHDAPDPDYSERPQFGRLTLAHSAVDLTEHVATKFDESKDDVAAKNLTLSEKLTKQYKEFSDFKFKHILGKKTVVRTTSIDINNFSFRPDDSSPEKSEYDFEIHSLRAQKLDSGELDMEDDESIQSSGNRRQHCQRQQSAESHRSFQSNKSSEKSAPLASANEEGPINVQPNKSSLFKQVKTMSMKKIADFSERHERSEKPEKVEKPEKAEKSHEDSAEPSKRPSLSKIPFNRQSIEDACYRAKNTVSNKIQKLKSLQSRGRNPDASVQKQDTYTKKSEPDIILPNISYGPNDAGYIRSLSPQGDSSRPSSRSWRHESAKRCSDLSIGHSRFLQHQDSIESFDEEVPSPKHVQVLRHNIGGRTGEGASISDEFSEEEGYGYLRKDTPIQNEPVQAPVRRFSQNSWESVKMKKSVKLRSDNAQQNIKIARPAPPAPVPKTTGHISFPLQQPSKMEMIRKRFSQKQDDPIPTNNNFDMNVSNDSLDSDAWIPDAFKGPTYNQISFGVIKETEGAWSTAPRKRPILQKSRSIDIFNANGEEAFDDFDEALKDVPPVVIPSRGGHKHSQRAKQQPIIKQNALLKEEDKILTGGTERRSQNFNKLLQQFGGNNESREDNNNEPVREELGIYGRVPCVARSTGDVVKPMKSLAIVSHKPIDIQDSDIETIMSKIEPPPPHITIEKVIITTRTLPNEVTTEEDDDDEIFHSLERVDNIIYVQLGGLSETVDNGDQILTLNNNNLSTVQSIGSSADIIDEPSDEVLLRLVQRLTSIKQSQKDISSNPSDALAPVEDISTASVKEDENQNYKTECINIADCEDYHSNNNHPLQRQTTLLSHELLLEDKSRDAEEDNSEDEFSDASNEFISYTIEPLNELNGYESLSSKEPSPCSVVTNNFKESKSFPISDEDSFAATNEQQETIEEQLLAESNMGSNVSRNSGKGLTGRRSQSSGNLYSDKREHQQNGTNSNGILPNKASTLLPGQGANYNVSHANNITNSQNVSETCPGTLIMSPLCAVSKKDRNKFCGSLPNHLDTDDIEKDSSISDNYCTFPVQITKGPRGLGLSISGGIDSNGPFPGLIRIKRLFPHQAAWSTGQLQPGDIILEVNGISLTGLTNYEALEVLRTMPNDVVLLICRPNDEQYQKLSPPTEPPKPPQRTQQQGTQTTLDDEIYPLQPLTPLQTNFTGEFEIIMVKQQGSLGFTLRKEDESVLGHYVRALVREPATTDGRIKPGDKIVAVNDVPLSAMTHEQAVIFLRQAADTVKLRLYRDEAQTPVAAMSPTNSENKTICGTMKKTFLRPEAINLLSDLAYKKQTPSANSAESSIKSTNSSPRRLKRGNKTNNTEINSQSEQDTTDSKSSSNPQYIVSSQTTSVCSDSEQSVASQCSFIVQPAENADNEHFKMLGEEDRPDRPSFLDLTGQSGSTPMVPRKPRFQFSVAANAYELNNLDNDALDAPIYAGNTTTLDVTAGSSSTDNQLPGQHEFTSLPCETFLIACKTESDLKNEANFSHKNPLHQSFHVQQNDDLEQTATKKDGNKSLLKWKGVVFSPEEEAELERVEKATPEAGTSCATTAGTNPAPTAEKNKDLKDFPSNANGHKVITVELNRGWNSRLGFSLQPHPQTQKTIISAIYNDSVAARDGRLKVGDQLLTVNDEPIDGMSTSEVIDLMRIIRGSIVITVLRKDDPH
ncbi:uncharacterized protein LOC119648308 isoform X3 [Hermetia illucens]|uniref:uncharacterized protein LOC119648308 isoform X3 n=1 Tax=Hermetia illucens TaxID=343691 RepID=UPI0018CBF684|nr:uncharacterized protein LOC119648308 isoform X3 [Hermetia illucens]